jgi:hypothetical protein
MSNLGDSNRDVDLSAEVLASPAYRERCAALFELFQFSREADRDPERILALQAGLIKLLTHFQDKNSEFKKDGNRIGMAVTRRLILILKQIADSVVWRALGYDRVLVQLLAEHPATGHVDITVVNDIATAQNIIEQEGAIVLVNDLTTILRHGDLTIIGKDSYSIVETKYGRATRDNRRAIRQRRKLNELVSFLNTGARITKDRRDFILHVDVPIRTYQPAVADAITQSRDKGYCRVDVSDCLAIEVIYLENQEGTFPRERPFDNVEHIVRSHNLQMFEQAKTRIAPYGIFPLDDRSCFDLISGSVLLETTVNFDGLAKRYERFGLALDIPEPTQQEISAYLSAPIAERKKLMSFGKFKVRDGGHWMTKTPDMFGRISFEFMNEDSFIQADRQLMNLVMDLEIPDDKATRFYLGYKDEHGIWS